MGFWHTGYEEFHEASGLEGYVYRPPPPVRYQCEHCTKHFGDMAELRQHRFEQHPSRQPLLMLKGRAVGALPTMVLSELTPDDVVVVDATVCRVNGQGVPLAGLGRHLSTMSRGYVEVELGNHGIVTRHALDFQIADEAHLCGVEGAFIHMAGDRHLSLDAVARFIKACQPFQSAKLYFDGLCHYLYGVMAKDRFSDSGLVAGKYTERYRRASDELAGLDRPLARTVRALVAFHFNQFDEAEVLAPVGTLRDASGAFAALLQGLPWHYETAFSAKSDSVVADLLTDQDTFQILADASHGVVGLKDRAPELLAHLRSASAGYDRLKRALLATEALAARDDEASHKEARRLARELASQSDTRDWAGAMLKRLGAP